MTTSVCLRPKALTGVIGAIPSKSDAHRQLICAALADEPTEIMLSSSSEDIDTTVACLRALGADIEQLDGSLLVQPVHKARDEATLNCAESGSTLRFLLPVAAALCDRVRVTGRGRLPERPLGELVRALEQNGVTFSSGKLPLYLQGSLKSGTYTLPGNVSSQYISGLLLALPLLDGESEIALTAPLESSDYVNITLGVLAQYGVQVAPLEQGFSVPGGQQYRSPGKVSLEGDWSNAAFFLAAGALGARAQSNKTNDAGDMPASHVLPQLTVTGLLPHSPQGDRRVVDLLCRFGAEVSIDANCVCVTPGSLQGCVIDIGETPDLLPVLAVVAAFAKGETHFVNAARLRLKESDRLRATATLLRSLNGAVTELSDGLVVHGGGLTGGVVDSFHDHRIAMAAAVAATACVEPVTILDAGAVNKSYPAFFEDYQKLGGVVHVV